MDAADIVRIAWRVSGDRAIDRAFGGLSHHARVRTLRVRECAAAATRRCRERDRPPARGGGAQLAGGAGAALGRGGSSSGSAADGGLADAKIAAIPASGPIFKDILNVNRVRDPKVEGVELYVSDFQRGISDRLGSDFFGDPIVGRAGVRQGGPRARRPPSVDPVDELHQEGEEVFSQAKSLLFRRINVRRLYDKSRRSNCCTSRTARGSTRTTTRARRGFARRCAWFLST